jgi:hypothetical protein
MTASVLIAHCPEDAALAEQVGAVLQTLSPQTSVVCSALSETEGSPPDLAERATRIAEAHTVVGLCTQLGCRTHDVLLQLGAAWAHGKRVLLLLDEATSAASSAIPPLPAQRVALDPDNLIALGETLANAAGGRAELGPAAKLVLSELFPGWGPRRDSNEHPIAAKPDSTQTQDLWPVEPLPAAPRASPSALPRASASLGAGRALADAVFRGDDDAPNADELDVPFGAFLASLGGNWSSLREIGDPEVWREATDNLLEGLPNEAQPTRGWYEVGYNASLLLNLAKRQLELDGADGTLEQSWQAAWTALREGAWRAGLAQTVVDELHAMLDNLRGPLRDYTNVGRAQARVDELAQHADA